MEFEKPIPGIMKTTWLQLAVLAVMIVALSSALSACGDDSGKPSSVKAFAQGLTGNWQAPGSGTYTNPAYTGSELYLKIFIKNDGSFRGDWGQYFCAAYPGAYGISIYSCTPTGIKPVSGRFGPEGQGTIELVSLGSSTFTWKTPPSADELAIELPKNWQGETAVLYRARLTRDGKLKPAVAPGEEGPLLSANVLYREFKKDQNAALASHGGKTLALEGRRGNLIPLSDGGAAVHVPDGYTDRALVLSFRNLSEVSGISEGAVFRFTCTVEGFDYQYLHLENCSLAR